MFEGGRLAKAYTDGGGLQVTKVIFISCDLVIVARSRSYRLYLSYLLEVLHRIGPRLATFGVFLDRAFTDWQAYADLCA